MKLKVSFTKSDPKEKSFGFEASVEGNVKVCIALAEELLKAMKAYKSDVGE